LFKGIIIGLITGMPLGPIGAVCTRTTLANGALFGFAAGLGSCVADSIYASVASLGTTFIAKFFARHQHYLLLFGGIILIFFGIHIILSKKENKQEIPNSKTLTKSFLSTFMIALANPTTIFSFLFVFSSYGSRNIGHGIVARTILIFGVFCGSFLWWIILVLAAERFHNNLDTKKLSAMNRILGSIIVCFGIVFIISITNYKKYMRPSYLHSKLFEIILHIKPHRFFHNIF
jgi:threonine/homoserine/homoserine lactone efflux protein